MKLKIKKLHDDALMPKYSHEGDAAMDLHAIENEILKSGERKLIPTGLKFEIPLGYEMQIRPRSGLALNHGVTLANSPGTVDSGYRGDIMILMVNHGSEDFEINKGDRIAQAVFSKVEQAEIEEVSELSETARGEGGFGSTGR